VPKYRKKPVVIEAMQLTKQNIKDCYNFIHAEKDGPVILKNCTDRERFEDYKSMVVKKGMSIKTLEGTMTAKPGDYIIKGVNGEFYPCKPDIFEKTYEPVD
jgi:hypothetical protein